MSEKSISVSVTDAEIRDSSLAFLKSRQSEKAQIWFRPKKQIDRIQKMKNLEVEATMTKTFFSAIENPLIQFILKNGLVLDAAIQLNQDQSNGTKLLQQPD